MIKKTVEKIEASVRKSRSLDARQKKELIGLLATLKSEIGRLSKTHGEHARSIAGFAELASHEATRKEKKSRLMDLSLEGLSASVQELEASHPVLVKTVNDLCNLLAGIGI